MKTLSLIMSVLLISCSFAAKNLPELETVNYVDLERYSGKWYEIARFDQSFQKGCTATTAEYSLKKNGEVKVVNSCRLGSPSGKLKRGVARAWVTDKETNSKLKVQFFLKFIKLPIFAGKYWILDLDEKDYSYAIVGDPSRKFLWFLARKPKISDSLYSDLKATARDLGYDTSKLLKTVH